ncbi:DUF2934 domain-containing protein [Agrobacterium rhizogenes]|jgi:hypothetical protein|nr:DUF2934 domain-containing protein [Rhizobium rhizogenes]NTH62185.1 DUF2934 domain-containing protein [Rhizobium rhizogenes]NTH93811.1 DUF2934 domain-containing protein [Rhizobium rhizogenes]
MNERINWISKRAYHLWECAGRPEGRNEEHWLQAVEERELMERTRASHDGAEVLARNAVARAATETKIGRPHTVLVVEDEAFLRFDT